MYFVIIFKKELISIKWDIEELLKEANGKNISREEVCTDCPKNTENCEYWKNCSRAYILGKESLKNN